MDIKNFLASTEPEAFITGPAGSGKTTALHAVVTELNTLDVNYLVTAYTHKAKDVLISKLPEGTPVTTLHSWLKKRPGINSKAKHVKHLMTNHQQGKPEHLQLLIVDEFSFINEEDYYSIGELQDELELEEQNLKPIKVLYVGDLNQLSPVKGWSAITPIGPYWEQLTVVHRNNLELMKPLNKLVKMIEGKAKVEYLKANRNFIRQTNINTEYLHCETADKIMLAYTNKAVEEHNAFIQGRRFPVKGDIVYLPTLKCDKVFDSVLTKLPLDAKVLTPNGLITKDTKYNPLKTLSSLSYVKFFLFEDDSIVPGIFGSYQNKIIRDKLGANLIAKNRAEQDSSKEFKEYKCINDFTSIIDFNHCMTIHKSQGSEFSTVFIDSADLATCRDIHEQMRLLYVSISRAKDCVYMNN